ncbi:hypothetical protein B5C34_09190 [Pacificimonas flava]|uniref:Thioredoxin domain-containing protein n=2 Tax=Pacificimonas TaxID=1960290 RepID=A0A219B746_9SPHN|nr:MULTISPECIES: DsbA family protein [Pacificimonas]MBZ6379156.1 DsbA family protein [Pacificimonas aurantium]OWV33619.1 hypothetical protein B5C34_09190 [Pacificimonas flava]
MTTTAATFPARGPLAAFLAILLLSALGIEGAAAQTPAEDPRSRAEIEQIVRDYILANPDIIPEGMTELRRRETTETIDANRTRLETPFAGAWAGARNGDVVLVEFFDFACPYCRRAHGDLQRLLAEDDELKVVWRSMPILSAESRKAAEAGLLAAKAGRYKEYHDSMFEDRRRLTEGKIADIASESGLALTVLRQAGNQPDIREEIESNLALARELGISGTPAYIVGDKRVDGAAGYDALKQAVAEARRNR